jgi:hypothetical protein
MGSRIRCAHTVLAGFEAFERFRAMNSSICSTSWSRDRENDLHSTLTHELGADAFGQLQAYALLTSPAPLPEDMCIKLITRALVAMGNRDAPRTPPPDGMDFS